MQAPGKMVQLQLTLVYGVNAIVKTTPAFLSGKVMDGLAIAAPNFATEVSGKQLILPWISLPLAWASTLGRFYKFWRE